MQADVAGKGKAGIRNSKVLGVDLAAQAPGTYACTLEPRGG